MAPTGLLHKSGRSVVHSARAGHYEWKRRITRSLEFEPFPLGGTVRASPVRMPACRPLSPWFPTLGCLVCPLGTGQQVRATVFDDAFSATFGQVMLPMVLAGVAVGVLVRLLPR